LDMDSEEAVNYVVSDPNREVFEKEFHVGFRKDQDEASVTSSIKSTTKHLLQHSDVRVKTLTVYDESNDSFYDVTLDEFEGEGDIISGVFKCPVGLIKLGSNPRQSSAPSQIVSPQTEVTSFDE